MNDLWKCDPATGSWAWMSGSSTVGQRGTYGTLGLPAAGNIPGAREGSVPWVDASGGLWLFGGLALDAAGTSNNISDMWRYATYASVDTTLPVISLLGSTPATVECHTPYTDAGATATDNCAGNITAGIMVANPVNVNTPGTYTVRYNVSDGNGNSAVEVTRVVNVTDTLPPTITLNGSSVTSLECGLTYTDAGATATDACTGSRTVTQTGTVNTGVVGAYTLKYNANDGNGHNAAEVTRIVNVKDTRRPVITRLGSTPVTVECGSPYTDAGATATDTCAGSVPVTTNGTVNTGRPGTYTLAYTANDGHGNSATSVSRVVTVADSSAPAIAVAGSSAIVAECGLVYTDAGATAFDACAGSVPVMTSGTVNTSVPGAYTLTYAANDGNGHSAALASRVVTVADTTGPVITVAGSSAIVAECGLVYTDAGATAIDACAGSVPVTTSGTVNTNAPGAYTLTYAANDGIGHSAAPASRVVTVADTTGPAVTAVGSSAITIECGDTYLDAGATADDSCAGDRTAFIVVNNPVDVNTPGTYTVRYNTNDGNGNSAVEVARTVNVVDTTAPGLTLLGAATVAVQCHTSYADAGATADDSCAGDISGSIAVTNPVDVNTPGTYTVRYNVSDGSGNNATEVMRTVHVVDTTRPVITLRGYATAIVEWGTAYTDAGATADDLCAGSLPVTVGGDTVNPAILGVYTVTYDADDGNGNSATEVVRSVYVTDSVKPVITLIGAADVTLDCGQTYADAGATANDACWGDLTGSVFVSGLPPSAFLGLGTWTIAYDVIDGSGNFADTVLRTVTVQDNCRLAVNAVSDTYIHSMIGRRVEISVSVAGAVGSLTYQWRKEGVLQGGKAFDPIPGANAATLVVNPVVADSEGLYVCTASDAVTSVDSPIFTLAQPAPPVPVAGLFGLAVAAVSIGLGTIFIMRRRNFSPTGEGQRFDRPSAR